MLYEVNYDLIGGADRRGDYTLLENRLLDLDDVLHIEYSTWFVNVEATLPMLDAYLRRVLQPKDRMTVKPAAKAMTASGIGADALAWLRAHGVTIWPSNLVSPAIAAEFERGVQRRKQLREMAKEAVERYFNRGPVSRPLLAPLPLPRVLTAPPTENLFARLTQPPPSNLFAGLLASTKPNTRF